MEMAQTRIRDPLLESEERLRYQALEWVYIKAGEDCSARVRSEQISREAGLGPEAVARATRYLSARGYLRPAGMGMHLCITEKGIDYIRTRAWRRRSVRDA